MVGGEKCLSFVISNSDCSAESITAQDMTVRIRLFIPEQSEPSEESSATETDVSEIFDIISADLVSEESVSEELVSEAENSVVNVNPGNLVFTLKIGSRTEIFNSQVDYLSTQTPMYMKSENGESGWVYRFYKIIEFHNGTVLQNEVS